MRVAVPRAWVRARRTILSADTVSFLAAAILYYFAAGDVRGFAFTLGLSTILDLVVVFLFTHPLISLLSRSKAFGSARFTGLDSVRAGGVAGEVGHAGRTGPSETLRSAWPGRRRRGSRALRRLSPPPGAAWRCWTTRRPRTRRGPGIASDPQGVTTPSSEAVETTEPPPPIGLRRAGSTAHAAQARHVRPNGPPRARAKIEGRARAGLMSIFPQAVSRRDQLQLHRHAQAVVLRVRRDHADLRPQLHLPRLQLRGRVRRRQPVPDPGCGHDRSRRIRPKRHSDRRTCRPKERPRRWAPGTTRQIVVKTKNVERRRAERASWPSVGQVAGHPDHEDQRQRR